MKSNVKTCDKSFVIRHKSTTTNHRVHYVTASCCAIVSSLLIIILFATTYNRAKVAKRSTGTTHFLALKKKILLQCDKALEQTIQRFRAATMKQEEGDGSRKKGFHIAHRYFIIMTVHVHRSGMNEHFVWFFHSF